MVSSRKADRKAKKAAAAEQKDSLAAQQSADTAPGGDTNDPSTPSSSQANASSNQEGEASASNIPDRSKSTGADKVKAPSSVVKTKESPSDAEILKAIRDHHAPGAEMKDASPVLYEQGLRVGFGKSGINADVETNHLEITERPRTIYVYKIKMTRTEKKKKEDNTLEEVSVGITKREQKKGVFQAVEKRLPQLPKKKGWATDFDLIWSVVPLFEDDDPEFVPKAYVDINDATEPKTGKPLKVDEVTITFDRTLDLSKSVAKLFLKPATGPPPPPTDGSEQDGKEKDDSDPAILTRGINAFLSHFARKSDDPASAKGPTSTNANTFYLNDSMKALDHQQGLKSLRGYFISTRPGTHSIMANINVKHSPFIPKGRLDNWLKTCRDHGRSFGEASSSVKGKVVKIPDASVKTSPHAPNGFGIITALGAYKQKPKQWSDVGRLDTFMINIGRNKSGQGVQGPEHYKASDLELCDNQPFRGTLTSDQTTAMLAEACKLPQANKDLITGEGLQSLGISDNDGKQNLPDLKLKVNTSLMTVPARLLKAPTPMYRYKPAAPGTAALGRKHGGQSVSPELAEWNLVNVSIAADPSVRIQRITVLDLTNMPQWPAASTNSELTALEKAATEAFRALGLVKEEDNLHLERVKLKLDGDDVDSKTEKTLRPLIEEVVKPEQQSNPVLVLLPQHDYDLYSKIKRMFDRHFGAQTICASAQKLCGTVGKPQGNTFKLIQNLSNIGLKFHLKKRGDNQCIPDEDLAEILRKQEFAKKKVAGTQLGLHQYQTIILGADVAHPTSSAVSGCPSIASVVGSVDDNFVRYPGSMRLQTSRQEYIADLADMVKERLLDWAEKHQGRLPTSVLFYRDGVSESQYDKVRWYEIPQLDKAFKLAHEYLESQKAAGASKSTTVPNFGVTFVIVGKRHNTRFYAKKAEDSYVKKKKDGAHVTNGNLKPGFVVDRNITHPHSMDFFLQSHEPLQGTGRSAHYFVLKNQLKFDADQLQKVTHSLCYIYARATKGVSYCAPAYYADRLCDRGRAYLRPWLTSADAVMGGPNAEPDDEGEAEYWKDKAKADKKAEEKKDAEACEKEKKDAQEGEKEKEDAQEGEKVKKDAQEGEKEKKDAEAGEKEKKDAPEGGKEKEEGEEGGQEKKEDEGDAPNNREKRTGESEAEFAKRVIDQIQDGSDGRRYLSTYSKVRNKQKYGQPRKNPWHPDLDGTMFYL